VVLGYQTPVPVTVDDIIHHTKAVTRGAKAPGDADIKTTTPPPSRDASPVPTGNTG
jgi:hypothetical protein